MHVNIYQRRMRGTRRMRIKNTTHWVVISYKFDCGAIS